MQILFHPEFGLHQDYRRREPLHLGDDLKDGINQVENEREMRREMAALSAGGCWLPRGLTCRPTNGPEDFQELVFTIFRRRLY